MKKINACVVGTTGKMSQAIMAELKADSDFGSIEGLNISRKLGPDQKDSLSKLEPGGIDVVFDFTNSVVTLVTACFCAQHHLPLVTGTTGFNQGQMAALRAFANQTSILWSPNMSLAVILIERLLPLFSQVMPDADIEIVEHHHRGKEDSPSGTALLFAKSLNQAIACGRPGGHSTGRDPKKIYIHSIRGGEAEGGYNEVVFLMGKEEVRISHRALSNQVYAQGALLAAKWLVNQEPGFFSMKDLLPRF